MIAFYSFQVCNRFNVTCLHLHNHYAAVIGTVGDQFFFQRCLCNILDIDVNCGNDVITILRLQFVFQIDRHPGSIPHLPHQPFSGDALEAVTEITFKAYEHFAGVIFAFVANCSHCQFLVRKFPLIMRNDDQTSFVFSPAENGECAELSQFGIGNLALD